MERLKREREREREKEWEIIFHRAYARESQPQSNWVRGFYCGFDQSTRLFIARSQCVIANLPESPRAIHGTRSRRITLDDDHSQACSRRIGLNARIHATLGKPLNRDNTIAISPTMDYPTEGSTGSRSYLEPRTSAAVGVSCRRLCKKNPKPPITSALLPLSPSFPWTRYASMICTSFQILIAAGEYIASAAGKNAEGISD